MKTKNILAILLAVVMTSVMLPMSVLAAGSATGVETTTEATVDATGTITITGCVDGDTFAAYKIIDVTFDENSNVVRSSWNSTVSAYFATANNGSALTVDDFKSANEATREVYLKGLATYIKTNSVSSVGDGQASGSTVTFSGLDMGEYFIIPTSTTNIYSLMYGYVQPKEGTGSNVGKYVIWQSEIISKHDEVDVEKTADKESYTGVSGVEDIITYTIVADIPTYGANAVDKTMKITDLFSAGLTLDSTSIKVYGIDASDNATELANSSNYTLDTTATSTATFTISISNDQYSTISSYSQLKVVYNATLNENAVVGGSGNNNDVTYEYSNYPYVDNSHEEKEDDDTPVYTYKLQVKKVDSDNNAVTLAGAEFELYRTLKTGETGTEYTDKNGKKVDLVKVGDLTTSDANGIAYINNIAKSDAEDDDTTDQDYTYYLKEVKAPTGYNIIDYVIKVEESAFTLTEGSSADVIGYELTVENSTGATLPETGGAGTLVFSIVGITVMFGAVVLLVLIMKRRSKAV